MDVARLKNELMKYGQDHLLKFWSTLNDDQKAHLYRELMSINYAEISQYFEKAKESLMSIGEKIDDQLEPMPRELCGSIVRTDTETLKQYEQQGLKHISSGHVAVLLLAGGQGTRLGVPYPKGMYNVELPSQKTLYQIQAERLIKVQKLAKKFTSKVGVVPWYIMTSEHTKEPTQDFFKRYNYFGLSSDNVIIFEQNQLPALTNDGKIILSKPDKVALSPDGNGGLYRALQSSGVISDMEKRGIQYIHVYGVDNILVKMADPIFIGFCLTKGANCGAKVVEKAFPTEAVGVVCKVDGHYQVVEYSEITQKTAEKRNSDGTLTFNAGSICNHFFTTEFLRNVSGEHEHKLQHHVARKKVPYVGDDGVQVNPTKPNALKMEKFVFDVFQFATDSNFAVWEVLREEEFSPLKNANGAPKDTPMTCRQAIYDLHQQYLSRAGATVLTKDQTLTCDKACNGEVHSTVCEISPLVTYAGEGLEEQCAGKTFTSPVCMELQSDGTISISQ